MKKNILIFSFIIAVIFSAQASDEKISVEEKQKKITELTLQPGSLDSGSKLIETANELNKYSSLTKLNMSSCIVISEGKYFNVLNELNHFFYKLPSTLTNLDISNIHFTPLGLIHVVSSFDTKCNPDRVPAALILQCPFYLKQLSLRDCKINPLGAKFFCRFLKQDSFLKELDLSANLMEDEGVKRIFEALKDNKSLDTIKIGAPDIGKEGIEFIFDSLKDCPNLKTLILTWLNTQEQKATFDEDTLNHICQVLEQNKTLRSLGIISSKINDAIFDSICSSLKKNNTLISIDFRDNCISGKSFPKDIFKENTVLESFLLQGNNLIKESFFERIYTSLIFNTSLLEIDLLSKEDDPKVQKWCKSSDDVKEIIKILKDNKGTKENEITEKGKPASELDYEHKT